jgi:hypothetical protein
MRLIWATRGRTWGFRFLRRAGFDDPLGVYEAAFAGAEDQHEVCQHVSGNLALRFADPQGRRDASGRVIPHDFVILEPIPDGINSVEDGIRLIWPLVEEEFERVWLLPNPPSVAE